MEVDGNSMLEGRLMGNSRLDGRSSGGRDPDQNCSRGEPRVLQGKVDWRLRANSELKGRSSEGRGQTPCSRLRLREFKSKWTSNAAKLYSYTQLLIQLSFSLNIIM